MGSAEAACLAIFSSFLRFRSLKGCVPVIPAVRQVVASAHPGILRPELCDHVES